IAAYLYGLFIGLIVTGVIGMMFRILPTARMRNSVLWMQIGFFFLLGAGPRILAMFRGVARNFAIGNSTLLPLNWFVALAMPAQAKWREFLNPPVLAVAAGCIL